MRNLKLVDAVISLHKIAQTVEEDIGIGQLIDDIRKCANQLHDLSLTDRKYSRAATDAINQARDC